MPVHRMAGINITVKYTIEESDVKDQDIIFFNRNIPHSLDELYLWRNKYGFKLVCDFDDHYLLDTGHYLYQHYQRNDISRKLEKWIRISDVVTVTHERLYHELLPLNKNIHILPNAISPTDQFAISKVPDDKTRLFWCGSPTHLRDLQLLRPAFEKIKRDKVKFVIGGYNKNEKEWTTMANVYTNDGRWDHIVIDAMPVHEYYSMYSLCDISLAPLVDNKFNQNKSNLKILEAANCAAPIIVSRVHPYIGFPEHLVNYVDSHRTWYSQINKLLRDPGMAREQGHELRNYCNEVYNFDKINKHRREVFEYAIGKPSEAREVPLRTSE